MWTNMLPFQKKIEIVLDTFLFFKPYIKYFCQFYFLIIPQIDLYFCISNGTLLLAIKVFHFKDSSRLPSCLH